MPYYADMTAPPTLKALPTEQIHEAMITVKAVLLTDIHWCLVE